MGDRAIFNEDEHDVDFDDTRVFAANRWEDAVVAVKQTISNCDWEKINEPRDWQTLHTEIRRRGVDPQVLPITKRLLNHMQPFPRTLATFIGIFMGAITPEEADFNVVWGLLDLNIKLSCVSTEKLTRTTNWIRKLRSVIELFNKCLEACEDTNENEARLSMVDALEYLIQILAESVRHLRHFPTDTAAAREWKILETKISENLREMDMVVKHLNDIANYSMVNRDRQLRNLATRHAPTVAPEEHGSFPIVMCPRRPNEDFYGRQEELERINHFLDHRGNSTLRTYTIYGRRGVGKTDIALQYLYTKPARFEAIFWIQCETSLSLRQSFTEMAVVLNLPGADRNGHHEENQLAVLTWLKRTKRESILRGYWPVGASGAILITSRKYYNFNNDAHRGGDTIKPFNDKQGWDLLMKLLGEEWQELDRRGLIVVSERNAAKELLTSLGGLALAIQQAAELIKNQKIGGPTILSTLESFKKHKRDLPPRPSMERSEIVHSLDSLWSITFNARTTNARDLLSVLSLLSPDGILIDLFLPKNQKALDGKLAFCKQHPNNGEPDSHATLSSVITPPPALRAAIDELVNVRLITQEGRYISAHRVVQEAMNYHSYQDLQESFDSASALVYEAFPKQVNGDYLSSQWGACQSYISHGDHLCRQFASIHRPGVKDTLKGSSKFIDLQYNCAWYLYETSDYSGCLRVADTARMACEDKESLQYAGLCSAAGGAYYELNRLDKCRENWETFLRIQEQLLPENDLERSSSYHNMGILESTSDNLVEAMDYFKRAVAIRTEAGDTAAALLANSYLCMSRVYFLWCEYEAAFNVLGQSEALFFRIAGADAHFMAHVHYAYGNNEFAQKRWLAAKRSYETSLRVGLSKAPIHPITAAAYYSLGCVEFELKNNDNAKMFLDKAMSIAQLRSSNRDDGTMARILWKTSVVLESDTFGRYQNEANEMRIRAEVARRLLTGNGEGGVVIALDEEGNVDAGETEDSFDALVPGYFR